MMYKILVALLFLCLVSGCTVVVPLYAQLKNMEPSRVCPMPMPACKMLFEWDDDIGNIPKQPIDSARPDDQITGGDIAMAVCGFPIYCYFVVPAIISDVFFSPYNVPAYLYCKDKKGKFELAKGDSGYVLSWHGLIANRVENKIVIVIERGYVDLFSNIASGKMFEKRFESSCSLNVKSWGMTGVSPSASKVYWVSSSGNWSEQFCYSEKIFFTLSDDFQGSIYLIDNCL